MAKPSSMSSEDGGYISGAWQVFRIGLNRQDYGPLADATYFMFTVDPKTHTVLASGNENQAALRIDARAGQAYFVSVRSRMGFANARVSVSELSEDDGRRAVLESRLAEGF